MEHLDASSMNNTPLHESWALAGLMHAQYGAGALPYALSEADKDADTAPIWRGIAECLSACTRSK
jgi:hypothetical protein